jgi:HlyD family secretion protein
VLSRGLGVLLPLVLLAAAVGLILWMLEGEEAAVPAQVPERVWPVDAVTVEPAAHRPMLRLQGFLESPALAQLRAAIVADVDAVLVREGDVVDAGAVLARLDRRELELSIRQREADLVELRARLALERQRIEADRRDLAIEESLLEVSEREVARVNNLATEAYSSPADVDRVVRALRQQQLAVNARRLAVLGGDARLAQSQAAIDRAGALLERARLDAERATIRAPFAGRVAGVGVSVGDRLGPGDVLFSLYELGGLEVRATLLRAHIAGVRAALADGPLPAVAHVDGTTVAARLERLAGQSSRGSGGLEVLFAIDDSATVTLGRFVDIELRLPPVADAILLPFEALYETDRVFRVDAGRLMAVAVERLGEARSDSGRRGVLVRGELRAGDLLIATQLPQAIDGLPVRVVRIDGVPQ